MHHLYIAFCVHHPRLGPFPSLFIPALPSSPSPPHPFPLVISILLSLWGFLSFSFLFFFAESLHLLYPAPISPPSDNCQSVLCIYDKTTFWFLRGKPCPQNIRKISLAHSNSKCREHWISVMFSVAHCWLNS